MLPALLLFIVLPLLDLLLLVKVAQLIGLLETVLLVVFTGVLGITLIKREGVAVLGRLQTAVYAEEVGRAALEGALLVAGGIALVSPGIITDLLGLALISSWTRQRIAARLRTYLSDAGNVSIEVRTV